MTDTIFISPSLFLHDCFALIVLTKQIDGVCVIESNGTRSYEYYFFKRSRAILFPGFLNPLLISGASYGAPQVLAKMFINSEDKAMKINIH